MSSGYDIVIAFMDSLQLELTTEDPCKSVTLHMPLSIGKELMRLQPSWAIIDNSWLLGEEKEEEEKEKKDVSFSSVV